MQITDIALIDALDHAIHGSNPAFGFIREGKCRKYVDGIVSYVRNSKQSEPSLRSLPMEDFSKLWRHVLTDAINALKWHDDREVDESYKKKTTYKQWLDSTFGNVAFGIDALDDYFKEFVGFEQLLYGAEKYYRDHFLHVIRVWLSGILILTTADHLKITEVVIDDPLADSFSVNDEEKLAIWTIIAFCHDLGYPLEKMVGINAPLRRMIESIGKAHVSDFSYVFPRQHQFIDDFIVRFISSKLVKNGKLANTNPNCKYKTDIQTKYYLKLSKSFEEQEHGILTFVRC